MKGRWKLIKNSLNSQWIIHCVLKGEYQRDEKCILLLLLQYNHPLRKGEFNEKKEVPAAMKINIPPTQCAAISYLYKKVIHMYYTFMRWIFSLASLLKKL